MNSCVFIWVHSSCEVFLERDLCSLLWFSILRLWCWLGKWVPHLKKNITFCIQKYWISVVLKDCYCCWMLPLSSFLWTWHVRKSCFPNLVLVSSSLFIVGTVTVKSSFYGSVYCEVPYLVNIFVVLVIVHINNVQWNLWSWPHSYRTSKSVLICTWQTHFNLTTCISYYVNHVEFNAMFFTYFNITVLAVPLFHLEM